MLAHHENGIARFANCTSVSKENTEALNDNKLITLPETPMGQLIPQGNQSISVSLLSLWMEVILSAYSAATSRRFKNWIERTVNPAVYTRQEHTNGTAFSTISGLFARIPRHSSE